MKRVKAALQRFMAGRYGTDQLNMVILAIGIVLSIVCVVVMHPVADIVLLVMSYGLLAVVFLRCISRNTYKRYRENRKFLMLIQKLKDRKHRYFDCPKCRQQVRVPRGKGKIMITCPRCNEKFTKKT